MRKIVEILSLSLLNVYRNGPELGFLKARASPSASIYHEGGNMRVDPRAGSLMNRYRYQHYGIGTVHGLYSSPTWWIPHQLRYGTYLKTFLHLWSGLRIRSIQLYKVPVPIGSGSGSDQKGPDPTGSGSATLPMLLWILGREWAAYPGDGPHCCQLGPPGFKCTRGLALHTAHLPGKVSHTLATLTKPILFVKLNRYLYTM